MNRREPDKCFVMIVVEGDPDEMEYQFDSEQIALLLPAVGDVVRWSVNERGAPYASMSGIVMRREFDYAEPDTRTTTAVTLFVARDGAGA